MDYNKEWKGCYRLTFEDVKGRNASVIVVPGNMHSDRIIDTILNIYGEDDAELEDIEGIELAFELELNGDFYNLKNVYQLEEDDYEEEDDDDDALED